jgi:5-methylcytosine-specific restriction endonuclease McrBC regulatory subunit McrC
MKWTVRENEESLCHGMTDADIPTKIPASLRILHKNRAYYTLAENIAGIIPFNNEHYLNITPKYSAIEPIELMMYIHNVNVVSDEKQIGQYGIGQNTIQIETLANIFARELIRIQAQPVKFVRRAKKDATPFISGKVDWLKTARMQQQGKTNSFATTNYIPDEQIPENILLIKASRKVISLFPQNSTEWDVLYKWSNRAAPDAMPERALSRFARTMRQKQFSGGHAYYYNAVVLAQVILGFSDFGSGDTYRDDAILFNMPSLYEDFVRTAFQRKAHPLGLTCQKGFTPNSYLFYGGMCELIPDISIYYGATIKALLDVKYKTPDSKDYYQIYSYMKYAELSKAFIVSPAVTDNETIVSFDGCQIQLIRQDTSNASDIEVKAQSILESEI